MIIGVLGVVKYGASKTLIVMDFLHPHSQGLEAGPGWRQLFLMPLALIVALPKPLRSRNSIGQHTGLTLIDISQCHARSQKQQIDGQIPRFTRSNQRYDYQAAV